MKFEIKIDARYFAFGFAATPEKVEEEWLFEIGLESESKIFERSRDEIKLGDLPFKNLQEKQFLDFTARGTLPNRLFLTECRERNVRKNVPAAKMILDVLNWFENDLDIIFRESKYPVALAIHKSKDFKRLLARSLKCFDTGIGEIDLDAIDPAVAEIPSRIRQAIESRVRNSRPVLIQSPDNDYWLWDRDAEGKLRSRKVVTRHSMHDDIQSASSFDMKEESDGTRRLLDLIPALVALVNTDSVYIFDELDRSLHPEILHSYVANFLKYSLGRSSQLIVTTHDTTLLKQPFIRHDEVWFVEKGKDHSSRLVALEEYKKFSGSRDLQRDYLQGRFGGVPVIQDFSWLGERNGKGA